MNSINTFLLSLITKNERYGQDVNSLHKRFQNLSLIYVNVGLTSLVAVFALLNTVLVDILSSLPILFICLSLSFLSFFFVKIKKPDASTIALLFEMHFSNITCGTMKYPLIGLYGVLLYPFFLSPLTSSMHIHLLNLTLCMIEYCLNANHILKIFAMTLTTEQMKQFDMLIPLGVFCTLVFVAVLISQKFVETKVWKLVEENYIKSENLTKEVVQAMEAKDSFVSMLSHEIRNPLNSLKGSIDYLLKVIKDQDFIQVLKNAKMSGDILLNLVDNVLDAAKLKSDKMEISYMETDIIETVKKVCTINSEKLKEKELYAQAFIDEKVPHFQWTDPSRLLQILMNIISNAIKFTPKGGKIFIYVSWCQQNQSQSSLLSLFPNIGQDGTPEKPLNRTLSAPEHHKVQRSCSAVFDEFNFEDEVQHKSNIQCLTRTKHQCINDLSTLSAGCWESSGDNWSVHKTLYLSESQNEADDNDSENKGFLKIQITDTGCGIEENALPKLFGMFVQGAQGARSVHGGTGLGLWICKQLCSKMNGDIKAYSKKDVGSSFVFFIPIDNKRMSMPILPRSVLTKEKIRALVVDDYSVNRYLHKLLLEQEGVEVALASDGKEALDKYKEQGDDPYDFIMMDVHMPIMDGFTSAKLIRDWEIEHNKPRVDVYFATGEYFNEEEIMCGFRDRGGLNDGIHCLRKPISGDILNRLVAKYRNGAASSY